MYVSFLIGLCAGKLKLENIRVDGVKKYLILSVLVLEYILLFLLFRRESYIYISGWTLIGRKNWISILLWDIYRVLIGSIGGLIMIYLIYLVIPIQKWEIIKNIGRNTSGIYILQTFANTLMIKYLAPIEHNLIMNFIEACVVCALCYLGVRVILIIPYASMILFGQKTKRRVVRSSNE